MKEIWKQGQRVSSSPIKRTKEEALAILRSKEPPQWIEDELISACFLCEVQFRWATFGFLWVSDFQKSITTRKHHCRTCGQIFCADCTKKMELPGHTKPKRVCTDCFVVRNSLLQLPF